jgi:multiple sugar transport system substrate-binding protein
MASKSFEGGPVMSQQSETPTNLSRRRLLTTTCALVGASLAGQILAACAPAAAPPGVTTSVPTSAATAASQPTSAPTSAAAPGLTPTTVATTVATAPTTAPTQAAAGVSATPTALPFREATAGRAKVVEVWSTFGGANWPKTVKWMELFEQMNPDVGVRLAFGGKYPTNEAKLMTAVAGGKPPDVAWVDGSQLCSWAVAGGLQKVTQYYKDAKIQPEDFWPPTWNSLQWKGDTWGAPIASDTNYGWFWNKDLFAEVGLDPEKPPTTIAEVDDLNAKIFKQDGGTISRMGFIPWGFYGTGDPMITWGWLFGGEWYDAVNNKITGNSDGCVKALEWVVNSYAKKYDVTKIAGFQSGFGTNENSPFYIGKTAMSALGPWELTNIKRYAPNLKYGISYMPSAPAPALPHSAWVGGWCAGMAKGAKNPDLGWSVLKFIGASDEGANFYGTNFGFGPGYRKASYYANVADKDSELTIFHKILGEARHAYPVMPVQSYYNQAMQTAMDNAIYGKQTPKEALDQITIDTQKELDKAMAHG